MSELLQSVITHPKYSLRIGMIHLIVFWEDKFAEGYRKTSLCFAYACNTLFAFAKNLKVFFSAERSSERFECVIKLSSGKKPKNLRILIY